MSSDETPTLNTNSLSPQIISVWTVFWFYFRFQHLQNTAQGLLYHSASSPQYLLTCYLWTHFIKRLVNRYR